MDLSTKLRTLRKDLKSLDAWIHFRRFLNGHGVASPNSYEVFEERLRAAIDDGRLTESDLDGYYQSLRETAHKVYSLHDLASGARTALTRFRARSPFREHFPWPTFDDVDVDGKSHLTNVARHNDRTVLTFCSRRKGRRVRELDRDFLSSETPEDVRHAKKIRVHMEFYFQAYDVIVVFDNLDLPVVVRLDTGNTNVDKGTDFARERLQKSVSSRISRLGLDAMLSGPRDLFAAVERLYDSGGEGRVVDLWFYTSTTAQRKTSMKQGDIRTEEFHEAGVERVGDIEPYRIGVRWEHPNNTEEEFKEVELFLPGTLRNLYGQAALAEFEIPTLTDEAGIALAIDKLLEYL